MYLYIGPSAVVRTRDILGIFDLDNSSWSYRTREFLERAEREGRVNAIGSDLPRSMVLTADRETGTRVWLSPLSSSALAGRAEKNSIE